LGKHYPKLLDSGGKPLTKGRVDVDSVLLLGPVVVGVGLSIVGTVFGHWLDLFLVSKKTPAACPGAGLARSRHRRRLDNSSGITRLESFSCDTSGAIRPVREVS
jgi:hypothetical protein